MILRPRFFIFLTFLSVFVPVAWAQETTTASSATALTLAQCYQLALKQSETIAINKDLIGEAEARFLQALGTALPHVSATSVDTKYDKVNTTGTTSANRHTYERALVVTQTLFSGFKEFAAMAGSHSEKSQRIHEEQRAEQLLWLDVSSAFYLLLQEQKDLEELERTKQALDERIKELEDRERIGRSRRSEIVNTQVQLYAVIAQEETTKGQQKVAQDLLEFLTGTTVAGIQEDKDGFPDVKGTEYYEAQAEKRPDVLALKDAFEVAKHQVQIARSGFLPSVNLEGDYFPEQNTMAEDSKWEALLTVNVPIFEGTETIGAFSQAKLQAHESQMQLQQGQRSSTSDIRQAYAQMTATLAEARALKNSVDAADENYRLQREDYQNNLVNNLDVLLAIQSQGDARLSYIQSFYGMKQAYEQLLVASGLVELEPQK